MRLCTLPGCERGHAARGLCQMHYWRWRAEGDEFDRRPVHLVHGPITVESGPFVAAVIAELRRRDRGWSGWAQMHGFHPRNLYRWRETGRVALYMVEDVCDALGVHPVEVYGDAYYEVRRREVLC